jgi:hypothetical protein
MSALPCEDWRHPVSATVNTYLTRRILVCAAFTIMLCHPQAGPNGGLARDSHKLWVSVGSIVICGYRPTAGRQDCMFMHRRLRDELTHLPRTGVVAHGHGTRPWPCSRRQSAAANSASRGRRLTKRPSRRVTRVFACPRKEPFCTGMNPPVRSGGGAQNGIFCRVGYLLANAQRSSAARNCSAWSRRV